MHEICKGHSRGSESRAGIGSSECRADGRAVGDGGGAGRRLLLDSRRGGGFGTAARLARGARACRGVCGPGVFLRASAGCFSADDEGNPSEKTVGDDCCPVALVRRVGDILHVPLPVDGRMVRGRARTHDTRQENGLRHVRMVGVYHDSAERCILFLGRA